MRLSMCIFIFYFTIRMRNRKGILNTNGSLSSRCELSYFRRAVEASYNGLVKFARILSAGPSGARL